MISPITTLPETLPVGHRFGAPRPYRDGVHAGIDLGVMGEPVFAADSGVVSFAGQSPSLGGLMVYIKHAGNTETRYMHLATGSILVKKGQSVSAGQKIAKVGNTGITSSAAHLHFEVLQNGIKIDPESVLRGGGLATILIAASVAWVIYKVVA